MDLVDKDDILHLQSSSIFDTLLVLPYTICHHPHGLDGSGDRAVCMNPEGQRRISRGSKIFIGEQYFP